MSTTKTYWRGEEELHRDPQFMADSANEFAEQLPIDKFLASHELDAANTSRRDFLKFMGFGITAATLAACEAPITKSLPYVVKPNEVMPGIANYYASTYFDGYDYASILVKAREGRPIHIEGNKMSAVTRGGVSARVNSSVLSLYNTARFKHPLVAGAPASWAAADEAVAAALSNAKTSGGKVRLLTSTIISPSTEQVIAKFAEQFAAPATEDMVATASNFKHVSYDAISMAATLTANELNFGTRSLPSYRFAQADVIVSIDVDFLVNWVNPMGYSADYIVRRNPDGNQSRHYQFETILSTTGANADVRGAIRPSSAGYVVKALYNEIAALAGVATLGDATIEDDDNGVADKLKNAARDLWEARGKGIVIAGLNDVNVQQITNAINHLLGNIGTTIDFSTPVYLRKGNDAEVAELMRELEAGEVEVLLVAECDPAYSLPNAAHNATLLAKAKSLVSFSEKPDKTSAMASVVCPTHHYLESWNDANPVAGEFSFTQPVIRNIYDTRQWQESLLLWAGEQVSYHQFLENRWNATASMESSGFGSVWNKNVHDGVGQWAAATAVLLAEPNFATLGDAAAAVMAPITGHEVVFYAKTGIGIGIAAENPWLQELPDPITKVVWDHYATMNPADMREEGLNTHLGQQQKAGMIRVSIAEKKFELPVVAVPGQKRGTIGVALGYGKAGITEEGVARTIGHNAFEMVPVISGYANYSSPAAYEKLEIRYNIASTQTHHTMMGRKMLNETDTATYKSADRKVWNPIVTVADAYGEQRVVEDLDLWNKHDIDLGHRWGMTIDLNACIGCGACVTACHSENNVPVVGKDEVNRTRTMSWIRIDRYFSSDADPAPHAGINADKNYTAMEVPSDYPEVGFMPVMCQHCNHAPCETVCPVAATTHSEEGFNQMAYNRCIGTRYCANNCPYKVRRFNWFNYVGDSKFAGINPAQDDMARLVLNPDVVVRSRGVMEKCSLCVQRVQAGKLDAKKRGEPVRDGDIQTACSSSCPTNCITFGDYNDKNSKVRSKAMEPRSYHLLEEVGVKPNIWYQTKVRNTVA